MKNKVVVVAIALTIIVVTASLAVFFWNENAKTPSEKFILRASDVPDTGWHDVPQGYEVRYEEGVDGFKTLFFRNSYGMHAAWRADVFLVHTATSEAAHAIVESYIEAPKDEGITSSLVDIGDGITGVMWHNVSYYSIAGNATQYADFLVFSKGPFLCDIRFMSKMGYDIPINEMIDLAKAQADKLPD